MLLPEVDLQGLSRLVSELNGALFGAGQDGDIHRVLKTEAGQLAWEISNELGPKTKEKAEQRIYRDVKQFITDRPVYSNLSPGQQYSSTSDFTWLAAGPGFLLGIHDEDNQVGASGEGALSFVRSGQKSESRGYAYENIGSRGKNYHQNIVRLNRTRVSRSAFKSALRSIGVKLGLLRASFAYTASLLIPQKRIPGWIAAHFPSAAQGRAIFNPEGLNNPLSPYLEFGSTARGVETNPRIAEKISGAVERRKYIAADKLKKVIAGYAYDWNTGKVFRRREANRLENN